MQAHQLLQPHPQTCAHVLQHVSLQGLTDEGQKQLAEWTLKAIESGIDAR